MKRLILKAVLAGLVCGLTVSAVMLANNILRTSPIFTVQTVEVRGVVHTDPQVLKGIYSSYVGANIFTEIPAKTLHTEDEWVLKLAVKRKLPDKLVVLVEEDEELIKFRYNGNCMALTGTGKHISVDCGGVLVTVAEFPLASEFVRFAELYRANEFLKESSVTVKNGFFTVHTGEEVLIAVYNSSVFEDNFGRYSQLIKNRYKQIYSVDLTVPGKIYVKGVTRG
jgi:hypothetical protein